MWQIIQFTSLKLGLNQPFIDPFLSLSNYEIENSHILEVPQESHLRSLGVNYTHTQFNSFPLISVTFPSETK